MTQGFVSVSEKHRIKAQSFASQAQQEQSAHASFTAADLYAMPARVRTHYVGLLRDWCISSLTKTKATAAADPDSADFLSQLHSRWQLLFVLLTSVDTPAECVINTTLVAAAAAACKSCSQQQAVAPDGSSLAIALQQTILALNTKFKHSFRPSLEPRSAMSALHEITIELTETERHAGALQNDHKC